MIGHVLSTNLGKNLDMVVRRPISRCTYFTFVGRCISIIV